METLPTARLFRSKRGLISALIAAIAGGMTQDSAEYNAIRKRGCGHGKHNGHQAGAFGNVASRPTDVRNWPAWKRDGYETEAAYQKAHADDRLAYAMRNSV